MGLCMSKSNLTLDPGALTKGAAPNGHAAKDGEESVSQTPFPGEGILMVQPVNSKTQGGGGEEGGGGGGDGGINHTAKGYLELGGKGGSGDGEGQALREGGEEEEDEEGDVEELINFLDSDGSLRSEFLE